MAQWDESRRPALNIEEAALLPALNPSLAGPAALRAALEMAEEIGRKQVGRAMSGPILRTAPAALNPRPAYRRPGSRAALHQVLRQS